MDLPSPPPTADFGKPAFERRHKCRSSPLDAWWPTRLPVGSCCPQGREPDRGRIKSKEKSFLKSNGSCSPDSQCEPLEPSGCFR
ncbi:hypothetical protein EYF80_022214 [Liparis tanakae]|uniref:Uncharacterized protein n=1 Tax=Liparis tanakae TaxID=230148 RepID=A0A4Z2HPP1_9TELE|nr:hypothetical protein EYF80_022214 [Liparis tanakae]